MKWFWLLSAVVIVAIAVAFSAQSDGDSTAAAPTTAAVIRADTNRSYDVLGFAQLDPGNDEEPSITLTVQSFERTSNRTPFVTAVMNYSDVDNRIGHTCETKRNHVWSNDGPQEVRLTCLVMPGNVSDVTIVDAD